MMNNVVPEAPDGIVIKATNFHSSQGVFVLVPDPYDNGSGEVSLGFNLIDNMTMSFNDTISALEQLQATKIIVEEFIGSSLPTEYKFHVVNGSVAAIDIIDGRGTSCPCYAVVDTNWNRLDNFGCFEPGGMEMVDPATQCADIDFITGKRRAGPVKKDFYICESIPDLDPCILQEMIDVAIDLGDAIGVYMRVDMFVANNTFYVQEYSANHMNGIRHCAAICEIDGCIDSCFLGKMWDAAGAPFGGSPSPVPGVLFNFTGLSEQQQCDLLIDAEKPSYTSNC
jgi:hypothetical protein